MKFLNKRGLGSLAAAASALLVLAACSSGPASTPNTSSASDSGPEKAELTVAINPSSQFAPLYYGMESGIFKKHGLSLKIVPQTDIASIVSGMASGQYDFGFATVVHVVTANANNIPIRTVSTIEGQLKPGDQGTVTIASAKSGITDTAQLAGKHLATVGLSSMNTMTTWAAAEKAGIDPMSIQLIQMPFGQMAAALASGDVDAAVMQWPFAGDAINAGGKVLFYNNGAIFPNTATTFMNTSQSFIDKNPNTVKAFSESMIESIEAATKDPDAAKKALVTGMGMSEADSKQAKWNVGGVPYVNLDAFKTVQKLLGTFTKDKAAASAIKALDVSKLVYPGALEKDK
jgi:NitT/TauT family transport system substrate-binding protein